MAVEEVLHLVERGLCNVLQLLADGGPLIGMDTIGQRTDEMAHVAVGLVEATLLELLHHHRTLYLQAALAEVEAQHAVGLQPEARLHVCLGHGEVIVGDVVVRPGVVLATRQLERHVIVGDVQGASEHEVFEEVGKAGVPGMLVACTDIVNDVQRHHLRAGILVVHQFQAVVQCQSVNLEHTLLSPRPFNPTLRP